MMSKYFSDLIGRLTNDQSHMDCIVLPKYAVRFISPEDTGELINLFHLSRTALSGISESRSQRMIWASSAFSKLHPEVSPCAAYKDLDGLLT